jgi:hypothetical protein
MDPVSMLEQWLAPITDPLQAFRSQVQEISTIHQNSVTTFQNQVNELTDTSSSDAMTGPAADAITLSAGNYTSVELTVSDLEGSLASIANAASLSETAKADILQAIEDAGIASTDMEILTEITTAVDVSAVAQGGFDVPDDIVAASLTSLSVELVVDGLILLAAAIAAIILGWLLLMETLSGSFQHPALPEMPKPLTTPKTSIPKITNLTQQQEREIDEILNSPELKDGGFTREQLEELYRLGYTKDQILAILRAIRQNQSKHKNGEDVNKYQRALFYSLQKLITHSQNEFVSEEYKTLLNQGFTNKELHVIVLADGLSLAEVLTATENAQKSGLYQQLKNSGLTDGEIHSMLATMTKDDEGHAGRLDRIHAYLTRLQQAQKHGTDQYGLNATQLKELLFHSDQGIVTAILSDDNGKRAEGLVAVSVIEDVTAFNVHYGDHGWIGEIDIATNKYIIEVKQPGVTTIDLKQVERLINNNVVNPSVNNQKKKVILFAPDYNKAATKNLKTQYDVDTIRTWKDLRQYLGLPPSTDK